MRDHKIRIVNPAKCYGGAAPKTSLSTVRSCILRTDERQDDLRLTI